MSIFYKNPILSICLVVLAIFSPISLRAQQVVEIPVHSQSDEEFYLYEGFRFFNLRNLEESKSMFLKTLEINPQNDAAHYYLGTIYLATDDFERAERYLLNAVEIDRGNYWYRIRLAQFYSQTDRGEVAIHLFEELKNDYPKKSSLYFEMINLYVSEQQLDKAIETLNNIENSIGVNEATALTRFDLMTMNGESAEANKMIEEFVENNPTSAAANYLLGDIYANQFKDSLAIEHYQKSIVLNPTYYPTYLSLAEVYRMRRQYDYFFENINPFLRAPDMSPTLKIGYLQEVVFNPQFLGTFKPQVDTMINSLYSAHPADSTVSYFVGAYFIRSGEEEKGVDIIRRNMELYPDDKGSIMEYLLILYYIEKWEDLIGEGGKAMKKYPDDLSIIQLTAIAYWQDSLYNDAIKLFTELEKKSDPKSDMRLAAYSGLGDLYHSVGNSSKSYSYYEKALKLDPDNLPTLNNYAYYLSIENKKLKKAHNMSKITVEAEPNNPTYLDTYGWILYLMGDYEQAKATFKHAMIYGGKENGVILDHYAEVLYALKEYDLAFIYWEQVKKMEPKLNIAEKIAKRKEGMSKKK